MRHVYKFFGDVEQISKDNSIVTDCFMILTQQIFRIFFIHISIVKSVKLMSSDSKTPRRILKRSALK